jgi:predicted DNA-binding protein YlxM (UPF0122 family)
MAAFNADFWEIPATSEYIEGVSNERALWYETDIDRERRYALQDFFKTVLPHVTEMANTRLTARQQEVLRLYYFESKTQEEIAAALNLTQSTVSRHLFGTMRGGKRIGGALAKLRKLMDTQTPEEVMAALATLQQRFARAA